MRVFHWLRLSRRYQGSSPTITACDMARSFGLSWLAGLTFARSRLHRLDDFRVSTAAAQIARKIVADAIVIRVRMLVEQLLHHQHEAGRAEAALERAFFDESLLDRVKDVVAVKVLDRFHRGTVRKGSQEEASGNCAAVDNQSAASAQPLAAALACAVEAEVIAHHFKQTVVSGNARRNLLAIEDEGDGSGGGHVVL